MLKQFDEFNKESPLEAIEYRGTASELQFAEDWKTVLEKVTVCLICP